MRKLDIRINYGNYISANLNFGICYFPNDYDLLPPSFFDAKIMKDTRFLTLELHT